MRAVAKERTSRIQTGYRVTPSFQLQLVVSHGIRWPIEIVEAELGWKPQDMVSGGDWPGIM